MALSLTRGKQQMGQLKITPLGGGLWKFGGDLLSDEKLLEIRPKPENVTNFVEYEFETFILKVTWTNTDTGRKDPHWTRTKKG